jgi:Transglycosylase-like domain
MSTARAWLSETDVDWSGFRTAGLPLVLRRSRRERRRGRPGAPLFAAAALIAAVGSAGALALAPDDPGRAATGEPAPARATAAPATEAERRALLTHIAACESDGDPTAVSPDGRYHGKYQFDLATWQSVGGAGNPAAAPEREQDRRAHLLLMARGTEPWPRCGPAVAGS